MKKIVLIFILLTLIGIQLSSATVVNITTSEDTSVVQSAPDSTGYGDNTRIFVKNYGTVNNQGYLKFDLTGITNISSANLYLYLNISGGSVNTATFDSNDQDWSEHTATWNNPIITNSTGNIFNAASVGNWYSVNVTNLSKYYENMNFTIILKGATSTNIYKDFQSKEFSSGIRAPYISVNYTIAENAPTITSSSPPTPTDSYVNQSKTFNVGSDQNGNWTWYIDSVLMKNSETNTANATYTNSTAPNGTTYNVTAVITNTNGSAQTSWDWTTLKNYITTNVTYYDRDNISINMIFNVSYVSPGTQQWGFNYSGTDAGNTYNWTYQNSTVIQSLTATSLNETLEYMHSVLPTGIYHIVEIEGADSTPPASITALTNITGNFWHNWTWTNPADADFNHTMIYLNSVFTTNVSNTTEFYNYTVSAHNTSTIGTHTVDLTGNINSTWVNHTSIIGNNPITISNISASYTINEGDSLYIDAEATDADSDTPTFADNSTVWNVNTSTGIVSWQTADGDDGTYHWYINVSDGYGSIDTQVFNVTVNNSIYPPTIELLSQTPSVLYQNSTGTFNLTYGITHSTAGLNNSSIAFKNTIWDVANDHYNNSIRPPNNDKAAYSVHFDEYILRGNNRNESLNFENNVTITEGNIWKWGGMDENSTELTIEVINSTYTKVHINTLIHDHVFSNMWYLDRSIMQEAPKTQYSIYKDHGALIKLWDTEAAEGQVHLGCAHLDTGLGAVEPTPANPIEVWYVNKSYNPVGSVAVEDSPYAFYMTSLTKDAWVDHVYTPHVNSSYARCITIDSSDIENAGINVDDIAYLYFTSQTHSNRPFILNMTNVDSGTNVSFADTNVMWSGTAPFTQVNYTPNMFVTMIHENYQYQAKLYTADNDDLWGNSTLHTSNVEVSIFPPTKPLLHHILYDGVEYQNSAIDNQTFNGVVDVAVGVSTDPDGGTVTHNLTLHYKNETLVAIINNTFTEPTNAFAEIEFNTTTYYSYTDEYTLRVIATDDDGDNQTAWLGYNFTLYVTDEPTNLQNTTGNHWVNFTWDPGANTDAYNVTFNGTWYNSTDASINHSVGAHGWGNITVWAWNNSIGMSAGSISDNVQVPNNAPVLAGVPDSNTNEDVPINNAFDLDSYFSDADGDSPSYSVYSNNQSGNVTPSIGAGNVVSYALASNWYGVAEIVYKVEDGYGANDTDTVTVTVNSVNDPPVLQGIGPYNVNEGQTVIIEVAGTDVETPEVDLDFTCNRTDLFTDFSISGGWTEWVTNYSQAGVYDVLFTVSDGTDTDNETVVITVTDIPLTISSYWNNQTGNSLSLSVDTGTSVLFGATTNRTANSTWYLNGTMDETDTNTTQANFSTMFNVVGTHYVNVSATDGIEQTANTTFTVSVSEPTAYYDVSGYVFDMNATAIVGATVSNNQTVGTNVTNVSGYYVLSLENGSVLVTATASGYAINSTVVTVSGDTPNQNITLVALEPMKPYEMLSSTYNLFLLLLGACFYLAFPKRGEVTERDTGLNNVLFSFLGTILAMFLAQIIVSGQVVESFAFESQIYDPLQHYFLYLIAVIMFVVFALNAVYYVKQRTE